jgi:hypothetical protein
MLIRILSSDWSTPKCRKKTVTWTNEMIEDLKPGIHDTSFASKSPFKKT